MFSCSSDQEDVIVYEKIIEPNFNIDIEKVDLKGFKLGKNYDVNELPNAETVSYTHLTLPTIYSV